MVLFAAFAEVAGSKPGIGAEEAIEVGRIIKAQEAGYLFYVVVGIYEQSLSLQRYAAAYVVAHALTAVVFAYSVQLLLRYMQLVCVVGRLPLRAVLFFYHLPQAVENRSLLQFVIGVLCFKELQALQQHHLYVAAYYLGIHFAVAVAFILYLVQYGRKPFKLFLCSQQQRVAAIVQKWKAE